MTDAQTLWLLWAGLSFGPPLAWLAAIELVRWHNRRNVVDLGEWRELNAAIQRHPASQSNAARSSGGCGCDERHRTRGMASRRWRFRL